MSALILLFCSQCFASSEEVISTDVCVDSGSQSHVSESKFRTVPSPPPQFVWVTFENISPEAIELYYDDGASGILQGLIHPNRTLSFNTYVGHQFWFRRPGTIAPILCSPHTACYSTIERGKTTYKFMNEEQQRLETAELEAEKEIFVKQYLNATGREWLHIYPRPPPGLYFYPTDYLEQIHKVTSGYSYYSCYPEFKSVEDIAKCRGTEPITFEWKVLSTAPKVLELGGDKFLSDFEIEHIKDIARPLLQRSKAGGHEQTARTSSHAWVKRSMSDVLDWVFRRLADAVKVDESHLWDTIGSESVQVVHYDVGQQYKAHHDWPTNRLQTRFATFLIYLTDKASPTAGGETEFPRVRDDDGNKLKVHPGAGRGAMFYDMLEDGNVDDLTLHAALPVNEGEKWLANVWIWDPNFS